MSEKNKRIQVSVHMDRDLCDRLEEAAKREIRSLSGEIAFRLRKSLESTARKREAEA
jgi:TraY domain-containing protein